MAIQRKQAPKDAQSYLDDLDTTITAGGGSNFFMWL